VKKDQHDELNRRFEEKVRRGIFNPVKRYLINESTAEDRWQDAVAQTWWMYIRYATDKGVILNDALLVNKCRWVACDLARRFVGKDGASCRNQDVYDPRAYRDCYVEVYRIDGVHDDDCPEGDRQVQIGWAEAMACNPGRKIRSAIDLQAWVGNLSHMDRCLMEQKMAGSPTSQIAADLDLSINTAHQKLKKLGLDLAARACIHIDFSKERRGRHRKHTSQSAVRQRNAARSASHGPARERNQRKTLVWSVKAQERASGTSQMA